jgi:hypothetical protein
MRVRFMQVRQGASLKAKYRSVYGAPRQEDILITHRWWDVTSARSITVAALALFLTPRGITIGRHGETPEIQIFHLSGYSAITTYIGDNSDDTSFRFVDFSLRPLLFDTHT